MHESAIRRFDSLMTLDGDLEREFEERVRESSSLAIRVAFSVLRRRQDAEDVAQEAFARAYGRFPQIRDGMRFRSWLVRTTWRLAIDRWRSDRRRSAREEAARDGAPTPTGEEMASASERAQRLWEAIDDLPEKLRQVIVLGAIQGYDVSELAHLLGVPEGTVKSRLFLARKGLLQRLQCLVNDLPRR